MNRTKDEPESVARRFVQTGSIVLKATEDTLKTYEAQRMIEVTNQFAEDIRETMKNASSVEQLIQQERILQQIDESSAQTDGDRASIKFAKTDYKQLFLIVQQMLHHPNEYIQNNITIKETRTDYRKLPKSRGLQQIRANKERLSDRASFVHQELRAIWNARIELADRTEIMLRELHNKVVADYEQGLQAADNDKESQA